MNAHVNCTAFARRLQAGDPSAVHTYASLVALAQAGDPRAKRALSRISVGAVRVGRGADAVGAHPVLAVVGPAVGGLFGLASTLLSLAGRAADALGRVAGTPFHWASKETVDLGKAAVHALHR